MDYLITGGAGFIGSRICNKLESLGKDYFSVDDLSKGTEENLINNSKFLKLDCSSIEFESWLKNKKPKYIFHLCGQSSGERSNKNPSDDFIRNVLTTSRLLSACTNNKRLKTISYASSMSVYGNKINAKENDITNPLSWYGSHKLLSEILLENFTKKNSNVLVNNLRLFNVYGIGQDLLDLQQGMISIFVSMAVNNKFVKVKGPAKRIRDFIHVDDVVEAFLLTTKRSIGKKSEIFNIGSGYEIKIREIVDQICRETNSDYEYLKLRTPYDQDFCSANLEKSNKILDFYPKNVLQYELSKMINWAKKS